MADPQRVLVTGGAGFLGSFLCERLLAQGCDVVAVDNLATGDARHLDPLREHPRFEARIHDVTVPFDVGPVDRVYHLAGAPPGPRDPHHGVDIMVDGVSGTLNALKIADWHGARFLLASSRAVYGRPTHGPVGERDVGAVDPLDAEAPHAESKRAAETLAVQYGLANRLDVRIARLFDVYGPRMGRDDHRPVSALLAQARRGGPMLVPGPEAERRSFCHVDDAVAGLVGLMEGPAGVDPVNLGHGEGITLRALTEKVAALAGVRLESVWAPRCRGAEGAPVLVPDLTRARARFGFAPRVDLDEGLRRLLADAEPRRAPSRPAPSTAGFAAGGGLDTVAAWPSSKVEGWW